MSRPQRRISKIGQCRRALGNGHGDHSRRNGKRQVARGMLELERRSPAIVIKIRQSATVCRDAAIAPFLLPGILRRAVDAINTSGRIRTLRVHGVGARGTRAGLKLHCHQARLRREIHTHEQQRSKDSAARGSDVLCCGRFSHHFGPAGDSAAIYTILSLIHQDKRNSA